jgi:hypothetical protein
MRLIDDVDATGRRRLLRNAYIWYRFTVLAAREILTRRDTEHDRSLPQPRRLSWSGGSKS